jgi:hypothetical protein
VEKALGVRLLKQKEQSCNVAGFETVEEVKIEGTGTLDSAQQEQVSTDAIALVCEYLSDSTAKSFISTLGTDQNELAKKQAAAPKRSKWADTESSVDEHKRYLMKSYQSYTTHTLLIHYSYTTHTLLIHYSYTTHTLGT